MTSTTLQTTLARLVQEIDQAGPVQLKEAEKHARRQLADFALPASQRATWRRLAVLLRTSNP